MSGFFLKIYIAVLFILMWTPLIQMRFEFFAREGLNGIRQADLVQLQRISLTGLLSKKNQLNIERWFSQNFGFREHLIKLYNQLLYSVFDESPVSGLGEGLILGKEKQIYGIGDVTEYIQLHGYRDPARIDTLGKMLAELQGFLEDKGIDFIVLLTPNKATLYPEYIPDFLLEMSENEYNKDYKTYRTVLQRYAINHVDGQQLLKEIKENSTYPLFPRGGFHWNDLGAYYVLKKLINKIEFLTGKNMVRLTLNGIHVDHNGHGPDVDGAQTLNLWEPAYNFVCPRPLLTAVENEDTFKPRILFEGGSYNWILLGLLNKFSITSDLSAIFYYTSEINYSESRPENRLIESIDWESEIFNKDVIVFELNLERLTDNPDNLAQGFVRDALIKLKGIEQETKF